MEIILICWLIFTLFKPKQKNISTPEISNEDIQHIIMQVLSDADRPLTITEIQCSNEHLHNISNQRICRVVSEDLIRKQKSVERITHKRVSYLKLKN